MAIFFSKVSWKKKARYICGTLRCPLKKGHKLDWERESGAVLMHRLVRGVCGIMNSLPLGPSPAPPTHSYACKVAARGKKHIPPLTIQSNKCRGQPFWSFQTNEKQRRWHFSSSTQGHLSREPSCLPVGHVGSPSLSALLITVWLTCRCCVRTPASRIKDTAGSFHFFMNDLTERLKDLFLPLNGSHHVYLLRSESVTA